MLWKIHVICLLALTLHTPFMQCDPTVKTNSGDLQGITLTTPTGKTVDAFLGIPYAEPPLGSKRFLPPQAKEPWDNVLVAKTLPDSCFQIIIPSFEESDWAHSKSKMTEDCLHLNIWVANPKPETGAAVMVWIHGGGFAMGSSNIKIYDGAMLAAEENVIVVSLNYRLTSFGFLYIEQTSATGNMGLLDQVEALKWINQNIAKFGGDADRVTIFGESAGASAVAWHLVSPRSKGLFKNAIMQSGPPQVMYKFAPYPDQKTIFKWATRLNCSNGRNNENLVECLRGIQPEDLISETLKTAPFLFPSIAKDGIFLEKEINAYLQERQFHDANVLIGTTLDDGAAMSVLLFPDMFCLKDECLVTRSNLLRYIKTDLPNAKDITHQIIGYLYTDWSQLNDPVVIRQKIIEYCTDRYFTCDSYDFADKLVEAGRDLYFFQFSHIPSTSTYPKWAGSVHGDEIPFIFGCPLNPTYKYSETEASLSKTLMRYWANFARYGNPNGKVRKDVERKLPEWPRYTLFGKESKDLAINFTTRKAFRARECAFWNKLYPEITRFAEA